MDKKISTVAVQEAPETSFKPYIPASVRLRELTILPIIVGTLLGIIFGASSLYLVLKTGLTVSARALRSSTVTAFVDENRAVGSAVPDSVQPSIATKQAST